MNVPEGYNHKATSDSYSGAERVVIYYSMVEDNYLVAVTSTNDAGAGDHIYVTKGQLELIVHAGTDTIEMANR